MAHLNFCIAKITDKSQNLFCLLFQAMAKINKRIKQIKNNLKLN